MAGLVSEGRLGPDIQTYLQGRTGILLFRNTGAGFHTELWNGSDIKQTDMDRGACFGQPRVLFWDTEDSAGASGDDSTSAASDDSVGSASSS